MSQRRMLSGRLKIGSGSAIAIVCTRCGEAWQMALNGEIPPAAWVETLGSHLLELEEHPCHELPAEDKVERKLELVP